MTTAMPTLQSERLIIRPFVLDDLQNLHQVMSDAWGVPDDERERRLAEHERWLRWQIANYEALASLRQPPYGDRAIILKENSRLIGGVGLVPSYGPFGQLPGFPANSGSRSCYPEVGLYWAVDPPYQGRGYATEAGRTLIDYAFDRTSLGGMNLGRIVAMTEYQNQRSIAVMRKLGMQILRNPHSEPPWFQVVGMLERS